MARTLAEAQAEYTAVRAAYLKALTAESYSHSSGGGSISVSRARIKELRDEMNILSEEIARFEGSGIKVVAITPIG
jgi:hypothetical protein